MAAWANGPRQLTERTGYWVAHVFVSYSRRDKSYVSRLVKSLTEQGIPVWFDQDVYAGDRWGTRLKEMIDTCAAVLLVMSPNAAASKYVQEELHEADESGRLVVPLLLAGTPIFGYKGTQYEDVTGGKLPTSALVRRLRDLTADPATIDPAIEPPVPPDGEYRARHGSGSAARRARDATAGIPPAEIPAADITALQPEPPPITANRKPVRARPLLLAGLVLVVLLGASAWYTPAMRTAWRAYQAGCQVIFPEGRVKTTLEDNQCLGYSDSKDQIFSPADSGLAEIQEKIFDLNVRVVSAGQAKWQNPYLTLIYLGSLTKPDSVPKEVILAAEREELQGMYAAQKRALDEVTDSPSKPLLRIVVANAGYEMHHADIVVPMLKDLALGDPSVVGVVGLVESRVGTRTAIHDLAEAGLPTVVPTLSADGISAAAPNYLQISAPNADEARLVFDHASKVLKRTRVHNFVTYGSKGLPGRDDDLYVQNLSEDLKHRFGPANYDETFWDSTVDLTSVCADRFADGVVFFGGRYSEFGAFADSLAKTCNGQAVLLADDSVNRYMANSAARQHAPSNLPVAYVSKGAMSYCDRLKSAVDTERQYFSTDVQEMGLCGPGKPVGERVGLAYDATRMLLAAVGSLQAGGGWNPNSLPSRRELLLARMKRDPYLGVAGLIQFDQFGIATGKRLTLLCAHNIKEAFNTDRDTPVEIDRTASADPGLESRTYQEPPLSVRACT